MNTFSRNWGDDNERIFISLVRYAAQELRFFELSGVFKLPVIMPFIQYRNEIGELMMK